MTSNRWSLRAFTRQVGLLSILAVLTAALVATPASQAAKPTSPPKSAKSIGEASRLAAQYNAPVEIEDKTTEYSRTVANPGGTLSAELSNRPVRVHKDSGWTAIDTTLAVRQDGMLAPRASTTDVAFSNGGTGVLARFHRADGVFELKSPWSLPTPTVDGSKATYDDVLNGVDLVVEATAEGFSYNLVVKTRSAAENPALRSVTFPVATQNLELRATQPGRPAYVDASGKQVLSTGEAMMWDSTGSAASKSRSSAATVAEGPGGQAKRALMRFDGSRNGLTFVPDQELLAGPATVFPVVLDPMIKAVNRNGWTAAWQLYPTTSFWQTSHTLGVGYEGFEQNKIVRSFFQFDVSPYTNKKILSASLKTYEVHSASCSPRSVTVSRTGPISSATTWNQQPASQADVASFNEAHGYNSSCPDAGVEVDVTNSVQYTSTANGRTATFRLRATDETDEIAWKQFDSTGLLTIKYVAYPLPAYELGSATQSDVPGPCATATNPMVVGSLRPQLSGKGRVGTGDTSAAIVVQFQIISQSQQIWYTQSTTVLPGVLVKPLAPTGLSTGALYTYRARTLYAIEGGTLASAWSGTCYFKIDTTPPPKPTITASYNGTSLTDCLDPTQAGVCPEIVPFGAKVTYTISSTSTDVVALSYGFDGASLTKVNGRSVTVSLVTPAQGWVAFNAKSHDAVAHESGYQLFRINVGPGLPPVAAWSLDEGSGGTAADSSNSNHPLTVTGAQFDDAGRVGGSLVFNGQDGGDNRASVAGQVVDTSGSFTISAWVRPTAANDSGIVAITGSAAYGGVLRYAASAGRWTFYQNVSDSWTAAQARVDSIAPPVMSAWTHLLGVVDAGNKTVQLYVNGRLQGTSTFTHTPWKAAGTVEVGSYRVGTAKGVFPGGIDDVKIYPRVLSAAEARAAADPRTGPSGNDEPVAGLTAYYPFDNVSAGTDGVWRTGESVYGSNMIVSGFGDTTDQSSAVVQDLERGRVLATTGKSTEGVSLPRPLVDASASFTVTAWVKITDTTKPQVIVRQAGSVKDSWRLEYRPTVDDAGVWVFSRSSADLSTGTVTEVTQPTNQFTADDWNALVAKYDAASGQIVLQVADRSGDGGIDSFTTPFTTGKTVVGGQAAGLSPYNGLVDDLRIYAGVVPQRQLCTDLGNESSCS
ncbi:LamG-like jellyroll fold domain-containing protein [Kribbella jejuensis]|uniref:Concanavalin A-like lectin/glucanase superfamily protein n=1 Tax=Kribbella jejuensis TaxID=236068 RepID=A0A542E935_9ACTN|nr:LamG-like jellyroll fold domain-containing protein [Kribbella jejuensis]TQJ11833.1 concanavalin A-like lectin/glucanase superfamily protein [Kribbella jejuensis]